MVKDFPLPPIAALKAQAQRLRTNAADEGAPLSHSRALEMVARLHGFRDWNGLHAAARRSAAPSFAVGARVSGRYLKQDFQGEIRGVTAMDGGRRRVVIRFDDAVDVVSFASFSNWRTQVTCVVDEKGRSAARTSDGVPHLELAIP